MTGSEERMAAFIDACVSVDDDDEPGVRRVDGPSDRRRVAERFAEQSQYHRIAADDHLQGRARLMAIREGYYAMLHKANEALARAGFESRSHRCTILGLRGVFDAPELTDTLRRAGEERKNVDYGIDPTDPTHVEFDDPQAFVEDTVDQFIGDVDRLVERTL